MERRNFLEIVTGSAIVGAIAEAVDVSAAVPANSGEMPKLQRFGVSIGTTYATTDWLSPGEARQFLTDAVRDMSTVMAQARKGPVVPEPQWLTDAVDAAINEAHRRANEAEARRLKRELARLENEL